MELNEISMCMDVKLDIYDKRPDSLKFKAWTKCQVKIEAIKCLPCFLRINIHTVTQDDDDESAQLSVSVNVPGVTISLATSRTKQHSYGLFWTHNRRDCFIYFALDTELSCRKHMKWIKRSIKNLELYRQVFLEQRRNSRGPCLFGEVDKKAVKKELSAVKDALSALGPLPEIPNTNNSFNWSEQVSRASEIYEEIFEENIPPRLSRRLSRTSIASGIYEEMKPCSHNIHSIAEEQLNSPPPVPPLPPHRKRLNTFESDPLGILGDIPRSNTIPKSDLIKKKKYKNILDNILGTGRSKRSESVSDTLTCNMDDITNDGRSVQPIYTNELIKQRPHCAKPNKRNSFSSPDLSKINFLDTFDEDKVAALMQLNSSSDLDAHIDDDLDSEEVSAKHNYSSLSLDESAIAPSSSWVVISKINALKSKFGSMESLNVSGQLPQNFNFSACNTSSINLIGASGAVPSVRKLKRNKIILEDELSGYCVMAPIVSKQPDSQETTTNTTSSTTSSTTSGYSTGSYYSSTSSSTSSNNQVTENKDQQLESFQKPHLMKRTSAAATLENAYDELPVRKTPLPVAETDLSNIYENMQKSNIYENIETGSPLNGSSVPMGNLEKTPTLSNDFTDNLYENLLTIKAAQELEQPLPAHVCTSTPTESLDDKQSPNTLEEQENIYQTPRKSIISVDDKISSYYPNSCDTVKMRRYTNSPAQHTTPTNKSMEKEKSCVNPMGLKNLVNIKMKRDRKENLYISSPQKIIEQRKKSSTNSCPPAVNTTKSKKSANAQKISDNVYTVNLSNKKSLQLYNNNNNTEKSPYNEITETGQLKEKLHNELLQLALLQKIDFKFDDTSATNTCSTAATTSSANLSNSPKQSGIAKLQQAELEYEHCYQATKDATRLLHQYATLVPKQYLSVENQVQHQLPLNQSSKQNNLNLMTQSTKLESPVAGADMTGGCSTGAVSSKKFASLPRFKKIDFSPLKLKINNVLQRNQTPDF